MAVPHPSLEETIATDARSAREAEAYDEGRVTEACNRWVKRVPHVVSGPNTALGERRFVSLIGERVVGGRALDVGCAGGGLSGELHALGARSVHGFDISRQHIEQARAAYGELNGVTFAVHDAQVPLAGQFDVIAGRSILHHLDFRAILPILFERNLGPGGRMVFMEPMSHPLTLAFHRLVRSAHTADERPLTPADAAWLRERFAARILPVNLLSFPAGIFSSCVLSSHENRLMKIADTVDRSLERRRAFSARGRQGIIVIDRPPAARPARPWEAACPSTS